MGEPCYICMEADPPPLTGVCACRGRAVHAECLARWVEVSETTTCAVCQAGYTGDVGAALRATLNTARHARLLLEAGVLFFMACALAALAILVDCREVATESASEECAECVAVVEVLGMGYLVTFGASCCRMLRQEHMLM
jgi:hypothetical protein